MKKHLLLYIFVLALTLRLYVVSGNHVFFFFDQARDAVNSISILTEKDLKIQGPSVSGTGDSVYHGVLYYYLIAPIYFISKGNPAIVSTYLALLSIISIYITYTTGNKVFKSKTTGLIAAFLQSVSVISIHQSVWLSNPTLSSIFVPLTYFFIWHIFLSEKKQGILVYLLFGLSLALSMQAALQNVTILCSVLLVFFYSLATRIYTIDVKKICFSVAAFFAGISTMLINELLMYKRGILSLDSLHLSDHETTLLTVLPQIISKYFSLVATFITPQNTFPFLIIITVFLLAHKAQLNKKQVIWACAFFTAPIWLLIWHYRDPNHTFIGLEVILFLIIATGITKLLKQKKPSLTVLVAIFLTFFTLSNLITLYTWKQVKHQHFGIQNGAFLSEQLALIDATYKQANGAEFSISSLTSPYLINTTWDYLYRWYGQSQYGYLPFYVGIEQKYFVSDLVLPQATNPKTVHFIILEPDTTLSEEVQQDFLNSQYEAFGQYSILEKYEFGSLRLQQLIK